MGCSAFYRGAPSSICFKMEVCVLSAMVWQNSFSMGGGTFVPNRGHRRSLERMESSHKLEVGMGGIENGHPALWEHGSTALRDCSGTMLRVGLASVAGSGGVSTEYVLPRRMATGSCSCSLGGLQSLLLGGFLYRALNDLLK